VNITILSVDIKTVPTAKGSYQVADVAYKNNTFQGKVEGKKIMSFGAAKEAFGVIATANPGETFEVTVVKNDKGYNDWVAMAKAGAAISEPTTGGGGAAVRANATASPRSTYETPEERKVKQDYIVRQSSLSAAVSTLSVGAKKLEPAEVIKLAQQYRDWVFQTPGVNGGATGFDDVPDLDPNFEVQ
jgi:hypothetical protein